MVSIGSGVDFLLGQLGLCAASPANIACIKLDSMFGLHYILLGVSNRAFAMVAREQFAWVWLVTMIVTYSVYFVAVAVLGDAPFWTQIGLFAGVSVAQILIIGTASVVIALRHREGQERDERDRAIEHRAAAVGYNVLIVGMILVGCIMPFSHSGWSLFHGAVLMIALAEIVRHGLIVSMYRRGWHG